MVTKISRGLPERSIDGDDTLVAQILWKGTNDVTGTSVEFRESPVFDLENGRITRWTSVPTPRYSTPHFRREVPANQPDEATKMAMSGG